MTSGRLKIVLDVATVVLVAAGAALWLFAPPLPDAKDGNLRSTGSMRSRAQLVAESQSLSAEAVAIVTGNMFSATRAAPARRYTPTSGSVADPGEAVPEAMMTPSAPPPRVYGTMTGAGGAMALIQPDSSGASGRLYREGERVGSFRIEKILGNSVVMRGPAGRIEIPVEKREDRTQ